MEQLCVVLMFAVGCASSVPPPQPQRAAATAQAEHAPPVCDASDGEQLEVAHGATAQTADGALSVHFVGTQIDDYEDGSAVLIDLAFSSGTAAEHWLPNLGPAGPTRMLGRCVRIVDSSEARVVLAIARH